jgi:hypothetical protein
MYTNIFIIYGKKVSYNRKKKLFNLAILVKIDSIELKNSFIGFNLVPRKQFFSDSHGGCSSHESQAWIQKKESQTASKPEVNAENI